MTASVHGNFEHDPVGKLVRMANQIGSFFETQDAATRVEGIADHIAQFWDPKMRRDLYAHFDRGGDDLSPLVRAALQQLRSQEKIKPI